MALIECKTCGARISSRAESCPQCGEPVRQGGGRGWLAIVLLLLVMGGIWLADSVDREGRPAAPAEAENSDYVRQNALLVNVVQQIKRVLRDPESMQFDRVMVDPAATTLCLDYRSKNGLGGYAGEQVVVTPDGKVAIDAKAWQTHCRAGMLDITHRARRLEGLR